MPDQNHDPRALAEAVLAGSPALGSIRLVTIDGPSGSGKSTLAGALLNELLTRGVVAAVVPTDHYATWDDPFGWWDRLEAEVLGPLASGDPAHYLANDWTTGNPLPIIDVHVLPPDVLILEGVTAGRATAASRTTIGVWVEHGDRTSRLERAVARDGEHTRDQLRRWQDAEDAWFAANPPTGRQLSGESWRHPAPQFPVFPDDRITNVPHADQRPDPGA